MAGASLACLPVCMPTKHCQTLKTALSSRPVMKQHARSGRSVHLSSTSAAKYLCTDDIALFFLPCPFSSVLSMAQITSLCKELWLRALTNGWAVVAPSCRRLGRSNLNWFLLQNYFSLLPLSGPCRSTCSRTAGECRDGSAVVPADPSSRTSSSSHCYVIPRARWSASMASNFT